MPTQNIFDLIDTWASGGGPYTSIKMNATDSDVGSASLLMDLQVGGASKFKVSKSGTISAQGDLVFASGEGRISRQSGFGGLFFDSSNGITSSVGTFTIATLAIGSADTYLTRRAAANLRLGAADAAAPVAQTLSVQSVVAGTSNTAGANLTITGSQGTGLGAGGSIIFQVAPAGSTGTAQNALSTALTIDSTKSLLLANNSTSSPGIQFGSNGGFYASIYGSQYAIELGMAGVVGGTFSSAFGTLKYAINIKELTFGAGSSAIGVIGLDAANTLALRNGANAQLFRVYSTYNGTNDAYGAIGAAVNLDGTAGDANTLYIGSQKKGSPTALTKLAIQVDGTTRIDYNITNAGQWWVTGVLGSSNSITGNGVFSTGDLRATAAGSIYWNTRSQMTSPSDGNLVISNLAINDFGRLMFGGTTSSFPAIKRSSTTLQARLADDTAFAPVQGKITTDTAYTAGDPTTTGYLVVYDSTGTAYKIPALAV